MTALMGGLFAATAAAGIWLIVIGIRRVPVVVRPKKTRPVGRSWWSRRVQLRLLLGLVVGVIAALMTGWDLLVLVIPVAAVGLPKLLAPDNTHAKVITRLESLEEWTRSLAAVFSVGHVLEQGISITLASTPKPIRPEVERLVARLHAGHPTENALRAFADDLNDPAGDLVAAALIVGTRRREEGRLAGVLNSLAGTVHAEVAARRQIETDQAKPRTSVRTITAIIVGALAIMPFMGGMFAAYDTPTGQVLLAFWLFFLAALLVIMRRVTTPHRVARFMNASLRAPGGRV